MGDTDLTRLSRNLSVDAEFRGFGGGGKNESNFAGAPTTFLQGQRFVHE